MLCFPLCFQGSPQTRQWECFLVFGNFSLFKTPFPGQSSVPTTFVSFFVFYFYSYLFLKTMGCFSGCLMSSGGIQKLFCGMYSAFKCSFDEFVGEKVVSPSYSSSILGPPPRSCLWPRVLGQSSTLTIHLYFHQYVQILEWTRYSQLALWYLARCCAENWFSVNICEL